MLKILIKRFIMNKRQIIASLNNIANSLDNKGLYREANTITNIMKRLAQEDSPNPNGTSEDLDRELQTLQNILYGIVEIQSPTQNTLPHMVKHVLSDLNKRLDGYIRDFARRVSDDLKPYFLEEAQKLKELAMHRSILVQSLPIEGKFSRLVVPYREDMSVMELIKEYLKYIFNKAQYTSLDPKEFQDLFSEQVEEFANILIGNLPENTSDEQKRVVKDEIEVLRLKYIKRL